MKKRTNNEQEEKKPFELSNKSLAIMILLSIVLSIGGTIYSINRIGGQSEDLTGFATDTGTGRANLSIAQTISITLDNSLIAFGAGTVFTTNATFADLWSNRTNSDNGSWVWIESNITVRNDGNVLLNLTINGSNASNFFTQNGSCGPPPAGGAQHFKWIVENPNGACGYAGGNITTTWYDFNEKHQDICNVSMRYQQGTNSLAVQIWVRVPQDVASGCLNRELNNTLTFTGTGG